MRPKIYVKIVCRITIRTPYTDYEVNDGTEEAQAYFDEAEKQLAALDAEMDLLNKVGEKLSDIRPGDVLATATLSPEARGVYHYLLSEMAKGNKDVQKSARVSALIAARMTDRLVAFHREAGDNDYTAMDALPELLANAEQESQGKEAAQLRQEEVQSQKDAVRNQYEGTTMWMKAPNGKPTNLTEEQWLLVRTPAFKAWFGDWEAAHATHEIRALTPIEVMLTGKPLDKKAAEDVFSTFGNVENSRYGTYATFPKGMVGKIIRHRGLDVSQMLSDLPRLFAGSVLAIIEPEYKKEGHKEHPNVLAYHHYVNKFTANGTTYYIRFSLREERTKEPQKPSAKRILHSTGISDIQIYEENKKDASSQRIRVSDPGEESKTSFIDYRLAELFDSVNTASKVVDENGEPLVVYHGSDAQFDVFDRSKGRSGMDIQGMFFSPWEDDAQGYGKNVRAFFLNIKNPADGTQYYEAFEHYKGQNYAGIKSREELVANGHDGVNSDGEEYIAFEPTQIKSVDNNGNFDPEDANIYHQEAGRETAEERVNRISQEVFQTYLNDGIMKSVEETVAAEIGEYVNLDTMADPVEKDKVRDSLPYIKALLVQFNSRTVQKNVDYKDRYAAKIEYARRCFDNDERIKAGVTRQMVGNEGQGDLHQNRNGAGPTEHKRGNGAAVQRLHGRISAGISNQVSGEKRGAREHFEKLYNETAQKHSDNQGAFSHGLLEQSAWHGSPYRFPAFDLGAIGSGAGAQAHGWGLYFATEREISERPDVCASGAGFAKPHPTLKKSH